MSMGLALYAPSIALAAVTPIPWSTHVWVMGVVVTVYSSYVSLRCKVLKLLSIVSSPSDQRYRGSNSTQVIVGKLLPPVSFMS